MVNVGGGVENRTDLVLLEIAEVLCCVDAVSILMGHITI